MTKFEFRPFDKVLVRDGENQTWRADFYSHEDDTSWPFCCMAGSEWKFCIPYNETTKHLCGTSDPYIDPTDFEVGDTVSFRYTENTTWCGEIVGITGGTIQVSVSGGVYSVYRERLTLVRRGEKKIEAPAEAQAFEFGDVVEDLRTGKTGIFSRKDADGVEVLLKKNITTVSRGIREIRLVRKGNFND